MSCSKNKILWDILYSKLKFEYWQYIAIELLGGLSLPYSTAHDKLWFAIWDT